MSKIRTKYGSASFDEKRGYRITSRKENNHKKFVHHLVWEEYYGEKPEHSYIVFKDGNKKNFDISNLELKFYQETFETEFGRCGFNKEGYMIIYCPDKTRMYHRVVWSKHYGKIPEGYHIHHIDKNKLNNNISNLQLICSSEHSKLHFSGENNPNYGKKFNMNHKISLSKAKNETGFYRVSKEYSYNNRKGYRYRYIYVDDNGKRKEIKSVDINKLKEKVLAKNLEWIDLNEYREIES
ncbi:MAG: HNH endonuclease [Methanobrevibacter sp.]|nr:HNH endonuclease [Methanobrevibacter sp.]MBQ9024952.1 HNH endonuclease [Methanobrevibacter sp.]